MKFFHVYDERYYDGLVKNNLINEDTGFKIMNVFRMPDEFHFNSVARKGGKLHSLIKENKNPSRNIRGGFFICVQFVDNIQNKW